MLVKESVNQAIFLQTGNTNNSAVNTKNKLDEQKDFASFLIPQTGNKMEITDYSAKSSKESADYNKLERNEGRQTKNIHSKEDGQSKSDQIHDTDTAEDVSISELEKEDDLEKVKAVNEFLAFMMNQFGLTPEMLEEKLNEFGMNVEELMTQEGITEFFLNLNGSDISDLLVNEDLCQQLQQLTEALEELAGDTEVSDLQDDVVEETNFADTAVEEETIVLKKVNHTENENSNLGQTEENLSDEEIKGSQTEGKTVRQDSFQNPILESIQDAIDQIEQPVNISGQSYVSGSDIVGQIVEKVRVTLNQNSTSMEMQLYPEHLGKLQIKVVSEDGVMTAKILAETEAAKQAIEGGLTSLKEALEQQNLKVDAVEVMVSTTGFEKNQEENNTSEQKQQRNLSGKINLAALEEEEFVEDVSELEKMKAVGSSVSYMA